MVLYILLGIIAAALVALVFILLFRLRSDRKTFIAEPYPPPDKPGKGGGPPIEDDAGSKDAERGTRLDMDEYTIVLKDKYSPRSWRLGFAERMIIGRGNNCDLALNNERVSHQHVMIFAGKDGLYVRNISETNRLKINGRVWEKDQRLYPGDEMRIGGEELYVDSIQSIGGTFLYSGEHNELRKSDTGAKQIPPTKRFF